VALATAIERKDLMLIHPRAERLRTLGMAAMADAPLEPRNLSARLHEAGDPNRRA
jgi:hypothetical protein